MFFISLCWTWSWSTSIIWGRPDAESSITIRGFPISTIFLLIRLAINIFAVHQGLPWDLEACDHQLQSGDKEEEEKTKNYFHVGRVICSMCCQTRSHQHCEESIVKNTSMVDFDYIKVIFYRTMDSDDFNTGKVNGTRALDSLGIFNIQHLKKRRPIISMETTSK